MFPMKKMGNEYHVPKYLKFVASLMDANTGSIQNDFIESISCMGYGSAKLICISKAERKFTVIVYGVNTQ